MRAIIQRVSEASVKIKEDLTTHIGEGLVIFLGIEDSDSDEDIEWLSGKISRLRIFRDEADMMNLSVKDTGGEILLVSQFTLHASTKKGNRPSFIRAAKPDIAIPLYKQFISQLSRDLGIVIQTGDFGAYMKIHLINDGPVTIIIDTKNRE